MYDRATCTLWSQLLGEPVIGPLVGSGIKLRFFPVLLTTWQEWLNAHPDTKVMDIATGIYPTSSYPPEDDIEAAYHDYFHSPDIMFPVGKQSALLDAKDVVLAISIGDEAKAYPVKVLNEQRVVNDNLGGTSVVVIASSESQAARVYERRNHIFTALSEGTSAGVVESEGTMWRLTEDYLISAADSSDKLARLPSHMAFWFGWYAFHPDTKVYGVSEE